MLSFTGVFSSAYSAQQNVAEVREFERGSEEPRRTYIIMKVS
jgi:hypothetical protein